MLVTFMFHLQSLRTKSLSLWVIVHNQCDFLRSSVSFTVIFCCPEVILQWQDVCRRTSVNLKRYWCWTVESEPNILVNHVNFWIFRLRRHLSAKRPLPHFFHFWPEADHNFLSGACVPPQNTLWSWVLAGRFATRPVSLAGVSTFSPLNEHSSEISVAGEWVTWLALIVFIALSRSRSLFPTSF